MQLAKILALSLAVVSAPYAHAAPITAVTVYADRARVSRQLTITCPDDRHARVDFGSLPKAVQPGSLQAAAKHGRVFETRERIVRPSDSESATLEKQLTDVHAAIRRERVRTVIARHALLRAEAYSSLAKDYAARVLWQGTQPPSKWGASLEATLDEVAAASAAHANSRRDEAALAEKEKTLAASKAALATTQSLGAEVALTCDRGARTATVSVSYLVGAAAWRPVYAVRAHDGAGTVELAMQAVVRQSSGEDWTAVQLTLSTGQPAAIVAAPTLTPLDVRSVDDSKKEIVAAHSAIEATPTAAATPAPTPELGRGMFFEQIVPGRVDVLPTGGDVRVELAQVRERTRPVLRAVPKLALAAYRVVDLVNRTRLPFLPGPIDVFRDDTFVGTQNLAAEVPPGARLTVSLGVEEGIRLARVILREITRKAGLFGGGSAHAFGYRIRVQSQLPRPEPIEIQENLPVSELDNVKVVLEPSTSPGHQLRREDGIVTWRPVLKPGGRHEVELAFRVDAP